MRSWKCRSRHQRKLIKRQRLKTIRMRLKKGATAYFESSPHVRRFEFEEGEMVPHLSVTQMFMAGLKQIHADVIDRRIEERKHLDA